MSTLDFSVAYRAPGIVDVLMPKQQDVAGYKLSASPQFDGSPAFVDIITASIGAGYLDPSVPRGRLHNMPGTNKVRAVFNPDTFSAGQPIDAGISDVVQFWMRFTPIDSADVEGADSDPVLILTPSQKQGTDRIAIAGTAPVAADVGGSLQLCLGRRMTNIVIQNNGSNPVFVAFNPGSAEVQVAAGEEYQVITGSQDTLLLRATGGTSAVTASFSVAQSSY